MEHNERTVKDYNFQYEANGKMFNIEYQSAYHKSMEVGYKVNIFYLENNPGMAFIPEWFKLDFN